MPLCWCLNSRGLNILGILLSSIGALGMIYGGVGAFIRLRLDKTEGKYVLEAAQAIDQDDVKEFGRRLLSNKVGTWLLLIGFIFQIIAALLDY